MPPVSASLAQRGRGAQAGGARQVPVAGQRRSQPGERVVEQQAGAHDRRGRARRGSRGSRKGVGWTRCGASFLTSRAPFVQRLAHQPDVEALEVAQAAVDELAGAAGRAGGKVAPLHQRHGQAAARGVKGHAAAGHAAADHQHVEDLGRPAGPGSRGAPPAVSSPPAPAQTGVYKCVVIVHSDWLVCTNLVCTMNAVTWSCQVRGARRAARGESG